MRQDNRDAFNEIYLRYWKKLYATAARKVRSRDDAKDIVQEVFCSFWLKRDTLVIQSSLSAYLFTATKYKAINFIEANIVRDNYISSFRHALAAVDHSTKESIAYSDLKRTIDSEVGAFSPKVREIFELSRNENLSIAEISGRMNISKQTVKNQLSKAMKVLRMRLSEIGALLFF